KKMRIKAAKVGFDWEDISEVWTKLEEELQELKEAISLNDKVEVELEFGDVFFVLVNLARFYKFDSELSLHRTNNKFHSRFTYIEEKLKEQGKKWEEVALTEMHQYWDEAT